MTYKTNWRDFLKYDEHGRRCHDFPCYVVETGPGQKNYMYKGEVEAMLAAEKAVKNAARAAREAELAARRPDSVNSAVNLPSNIAEPAVISTERRGSSPPDRARHSRKCLVCSHPDRDAIEGEFIRWRSPHKIARDYNVPDRNSIYRHAHATDLFAERRRHVARVLESYLETIDDNPPEDFDPVTRAVRVYAHLNTHGGWVEPRRVVHILSSRIDSPGPSPDPDFDPDPEPDLDLAPELDPEPGNNAEFPAPQMPEQVSGVEARDFSHGEQRFSAVEKDDTLTVPASGSAVSDRPSRASQEQSASAVNKPKTAEFRSAEANTSTKVSGFVLTNPDPENVPASRPLAACPPWRR